MQRRIQRVHILGGPGSGKTYLAEKLAERLAIRRVDLDELFWDNTAAGYNTRREAEHRDRLLGDIVRQEQWILEGVYHAWLQGSFDRADVIVVLRASVWLRHWRIVRRFLGRRLIARGHPRRETFASLGSLLRWNHRFNGDNLRRAMEMLAIHEDKVRVFSNNHDAYRVIVEISEAAGTPQLGEGEGGRQTARGSSIRR